MSMNVKKKGVTSDINITPYIDILLVLLIIFMVCVPMKKYDHPIRIPKPAQQVQQKPVKSDAIIVDMDVDHNIKLNNQPYTMADLESKLSQVFAPRSAKKDVFIRADSSIPYGQVFPLLDLVRRSGATDIALIQRHDGKNTTAEASQSAH
jgi:biopolymer transport protein ExbD